MPDLAEWHFQRFSGVDPSLNTCIIIVVVVFVVVVMIIVLGFHTRTNRMYTVIKITRRFAKMVTRTIRTRTHVIVVYILHCCSTLVLNETREY